MLVANAVYANTPTDFSTAVEVGVSASPNKTQPTLSLHSGTSNIVAKVIANNNTQGIKLATAGDNIVVSASAAQTKEKVQNTNIKGVSFSGNATYVTDKGFVGGAVTHQNISSANLGTTRTISNPTQSVEIRDNQQITTTTTTITDTTR
ncbi:hypothetical protein BMT54_10070 [Pasteurellaceae bacterium 15-036681]|nr:hypothetical protein BMT54_10070 [Pasteurellaceae bacterium 15-036681]